MNVPTPSRSLKIGTIIDKTLGVVEHSARAAAIYVAALTVINAAITYFTLEMTSVTDALVKAGANVVIGIVAAYLLLDAMLQKTGLRARGEQEVFLSYCALSIVYILGVMAGLLAIIIGALLVMARWSIAQPLLVARGGGVMKALGESWERTRGFEIQIIAAALALLLPLFIVLFATGRLFEPENPVGIVIAQFATSATSAVSLAMGVALYGLIEVARNAASPAG